ncbi:hypothetical protein Scep_021904 [Stephania cephalantha]|uniref:Uncharacterized protein n=1 Tax=Stephania cephalantha TaxID=152367 RepID=A0AAP0I1U1_9MAGN
MAALTCNATISQNLAHENKTVHLRDASFSAYLSNSEEGLMLKLGESMRKRSATIIANPQEPLYQVSLGRKKTEDGEISVFGAEKYFNGAIDKGESRISVKARPKQYVKEHDDDSTAIEQHAMQPRTKLGTPSTTCSSEVSWNSQNALLPALQSVPSPNGRIKVSRSFFTTFGCKYCYCSDDKAVEIEEHAGDVKGSVIHTNRKNIDDHHRKVHHAIDATGVEQITDVTTPSKKFGDVDVNLLKENCFTFSTSKTEVGNVSFKRQFVEEARRTLEVFGSPIEDNEDEEDAEEDKIASSLEKKLSMLTWDATPRAENTPVMTPNKGMNNNADNGDIESDSSSDLFEIKSFASNPMNPAFLRRQPSDGMSGCMYEPSEASIEWSVATVSAANLSVVTDYNVDPKLMSFACTPKSTLPTGRKTNNKSTIATKGMVMKDVPRRIPGMLSGCRNQKAVKVVGEAQRILVKAKPEVRLQQSESFMEMEKVADPNVKDFELAHAQRAFGTPGAFAYLHSGPGSDSMFIR